MGADGDFATFAAARWSTMFRLAFLLTGSVSVAEDVLQTALEKAYVRWARISEMAAPEAYVRKVIVNTAISGHRRSSGRRELLRDVVHDSVEPPDRGVVDHELLWPLVCALPERQRAVVVLRFYEDLTEAGTAEVLGCAVGTVKSQMHDAMKALRRGIDAYNAEVVSES
jgi:RNA polymerase sigma-70 factor (sigma-E family)